MVAQTGRFQLKWQSYCVTRPPVGSLLCSYSCQSYLNVLQSKPKSMATRKRWHQVLDRIQDFSRDWFSPSWKLHSLFQMSYTVSAFCHCIDLRKGCIIIGILQLVGAAIGCVVNVLALSLTALVEEERRLICSEGRTSPHEGFCTVLVDGTGEAVLSITLAILISHVIISSLLIQGSRKQISWMLLPWLLAAAVSLVINVVLLILQCVYLEGSQAWLILPNVIFIVLGIYSMNVVYSYRARLNLMGVANVPLNRVWN